MSVCECVCVCGNGTPPEADATPLSMQVPRTCTLLTRPQAGRATRRWWMSSTMISRASRCVVAMTASPCCLFTLLARVGAALRESALPVSPP